MYRGRAHRGLPGPRDHRGPRPPFNPGYHPPPEPPHGPPPRGHYSEPWVAAPPREVSPEAWSRRTFAPLSPGLEEASENIHMKKALIYVFIE